MTQEYPPILFIKCGAVSNHKLWRVRKGRCHYLSLMWNHLVLCLISVGILRLGRRNLILLWCLRVSIHLARTHLLLKLWLILLLVYRLAHLVRIVVVSFQLDFIQVLELVRQVNLILHTLHSLLTLLAPLIIVSLGRWLITTLGVSITYILSLIWISLSCRRRTWLEVVDWWLVVDIVNLVTHR